MRWYRPSEIEYCLKCIIPKVICHNFSLSNKNVIPEDY